MNKDKADFILERFITASGSISHSVACCAVELEKTKDKKQYKTCLKWAQEEEKTFKKELNSWIKEHDKQLMVEIENKMNKDKADFEKLINGICVTFSQIQMSNHQDDYKEHEDCIEELWEFIQKREKEAKIDILDELETKMTHNPRIDKTTCVHVPTATILGTIENIKTTEPRRKKRILTN